ncbi:MAG TPA: hypothetical protein VHB27_21760 [Rhodopila sp.]|uniref:hypothetical protein n=1 Tax=Rhodopila sp. TaxID=2480087 RepID=UPI002BB5EAC8|nr:hypothetical protein [Rhodopila sp.]HVY17860.1 hypothetical protein [Rhodopila sp.]
MPARDFWADEAKAMELTLVGTRLIVQEVADIFRDLWGRAIQTVRHSRLKTY